MKICDMKPYFNVERNTMDDIYFYMLGHRS